MRAVVLDEAGRPKLADISEPKGDGKLVRVLACGLCGSDVEKLGKAPTGTVLGHEVAAELPDGRRVALVHHLPCGKCERCRAGHESTCEEFSAATIRPGGFAERVRAREWIEIPTPIPDATASFAEPLACVLRAAERVPRGRVLVVGCGFIGNLFVQVLRRRGDDVYGVDPRRERLELAGVKPPRREVDASVLAAPAGTDQALRRLAPGGTLVVFAAAGQLDLDAVYRRELHVVGCRSATPRHVLAAVNLLPDLEPLPTTTLPLERFAEGLEAYTGGEALKVIFTP
ncbi:MAG TPA: alcohol dehydrogenase catalytic domain-containing protein [Gaiellaceae bacterium]